MEKKKIVLKNEIVAYLDTEKGDYPLIFIHGNTSSSLFFLPLIEKLKDEYRIIAPDLRGFGDTTYNQRFDSFDELADDVYEFLTLLNIQKAFVLGWSLGGGVALKLTAKYPDLVEKLFLLNSTSYNGFPLFKKDSVNNTYGPYLNKEDLSQDPVSVQPLLGIFASKNSAVMEAVLNASIYPVNKPDPTYQAICVEECLKERSLIDADWAITNLNMSHQSSLYAVGDGSIDLVKCPVYLTRGDTDYLVSQKMFEDNISAIKNSHSIFYPQCGHSPIVDKLDELVKDIKELINK